MQNRKTHRSNGRPLNGAAPRPSATGSRLELERAIHELEVYQEEIRIQNQQLIESQRLLEESRDRYAHLYDLAPIAYATLCPNGVIREINRIGADMLGITRTNAIDTPLVLFIHPVSRKTFLNHMRRCRAGRTPLKTELTMVSRQGRHLDIELTSGTGFEIEPGEWRYPTTLFDLTERKHAEEERRHLLTASRSVAELKVAADNLRQAKESAEAASRMKDNFLAVVSHELRTPLTTILLWARLLRKGNLNESVHSQAVDSIEQSALAQLKLVDDLLDVSRIVAGKLRLSLRPTHLRTVIEAAMQVVRPSAKARGVTLSSPPGSDCVIRMDGDRIRQVITNLLDNAVKFTPKGGRVRLATRYTQKSVVLTVTDNGRGIEKQLLPHVFERFRQADHLSGGIGLGLSIARQLVELHHGRIEAKSAGLGKGTTFLIELPLHLKTMKVPQTK